MIKKKNNDKALRIRCLHRLQRLLQGHYVPSLEGIRAVSFMLVFGAHAGLGAFLPADLGVTMFSCQSGALYNYHAHADRVRKEWFGQHPIFLATSRIANTSAILCNDVDRHGARAQPLPARGGARLCRGGELLFYTNYWGIYGNSDFPPGTDVVWSLAVEEHFYLLFPRLYIAMQKWGMPRQRQAMLLWGLCAVILAWRCRLFIVMHAPSGRIYVATDTRRDSILFGCALAVWNNPVLDKPTLRPASGNTCCCQRLLSRCYCVPCMAGRYSGTRGISLFRALHWRWYLPRQYDFTDGLCFDS